jgi:hypothetical protein
LTCRWLTLRCQTVGWLLSNPQQRPARCAAPSTSSPRCRSATTRCSLRRLQPGCARPRAPPDQTAFSTWPLRTRPSVVGHPRRGVAPAVVRGTSGSLQQIRNISDPLNFRTHIRESADLARKSYAGASLEGDSRFGAGQAGRFLTLRARGPRDLPLHWQNGGRFSPTIRDPENVDLFFRSQKRTGFGRAFRTVTIGG